MRRADHGGNFVDAPKSYLTRGKARAYACSATGSCV